MCLEESAQSKFSRGAICSIAVELKSGKERNIFSFYHQGAARPTQFGKEGRRRREKTQKGDRNATGTQNRKVEWNEWKRTRKTYTWEVEWGGTVRRH